MRRAASVDPAIGDRDCDARFAWKEPDDLSANSAAFRYFVSYGAQTADHLLQRGMSDSASDNSTDANSDADGGGSYH
jgi:hypothetical protein